ncbi:WD domain G-beta repeat family protein [Babesia bovis T2Bo]|uniref:WD domain G-beta repeat family protein n=1 Tax=Babesia bovis T2Bo TaxID=484906 RepID=UPI001C34685B|nr:WD domain G-beta repeat family protein [Babesia bovis T2Bo]EDO06678.2 WD domain G-beta repeat family protein [Babesia bovis T2Bo]
MESAEQANVIYSIDIDGNPSCINAFPSGHFRDVTLEGAILTSTYNYSSSSKSRTGGIFLFNPCSNLKAILAQKVDSYDSSFSCHMSYVSLPGVVYTTWIRTSDYYAAISVTAQLGVSVDRVVADDTSAPRLQHCSVIDLDNATGGVGLSLCVNDDSGSLCSVTSSDGYVYLIENGMQTMKWRAHNMETWTSSFVPGNSNLLLTGSDDSTVKLFDTREGTSPLYTLKHHSYGVTALKFMQDNTNIFYSGSFDCRLYQFDIRNLVTPVSNSLLEGPIWNLDYINRHRIHIAGCHDGAFVYDTDLNGVPTSLVKRLFLEDCLIYGATHVSVDKEPIYTSCNFYKKKVIFWQ